MKDNTPKKALTRRKRWRKVFLRELARRGIVRDAARAAGVSTQHPYKERERHPEFAAAWERSLNRAADRLEREAWRRSTEGLVRKKFTKDGDPVIDPETGQQYFEREYSDTLLIFMLKGIRPQKYRDNHHLTGDGTATAPSMVIFNVPAIPND